MPVAKSFQNFEMLTTEPYYVSGKAYMRVRNPKTGTERQVRWYSEQEYARLYPDAPAASKEEVNVYTAPQKEVLGFQKGYITIFKGDQELHAEYLRESNARYARWWGWYIISTENIPPDLPPGLEPIQLYWEQVGNDNGRLKLENEIKSAVNALVYEESNSQYVGKIGERLDFYIQITNAIVLENNFGRSTMYLMKDANSDNLFTWTTASKNWAPSDEVIHLRGTVKDHRVYKNQKQTVLTRCMKVG